MARPLRALNDPVRLTVAVCVAIAVAGIVVILLSAGRMAALDTPARQVPFLVSGGLTGFALLVFGTAGALLQAGRQAAARTAGELAELADALDSFSIRRRATIADGDT